MADVLWIITRLIPGGTRRILLWSAEILKRVAGEEIRLSIASGPEGVDEEITRTLARIGIPLHLIPHLHRSPHPIRDLVALREISNLLRLHPPHLVHTHTSKAGCLGRLAAHRSRIGAVVHTPHGHVFDRFFTGPLALLPARAAILLERQAARWCDTLIALSRREADDYERLGIRPRKGVAIIPNGLPSLLIPPAPPSLATETATVGFVGRLVPEKGMADLLAALPLVRKVIPGVRLLVAGDGPLRSRLAARARSLRIADRVTFLGHQDNLDSFWSAINVLALPARAEGFGLVLLEAMAHAKPIVAADVGGISEVVEENITGALVRPGRPNLLADRLIALLKNPVAQRAMGRAGWKRLGEKFQLEPQVQTLLSRYREILTL